MPEKSSFPHQGDVNFVAAVVALVMIVCFFAALLYINTLSMETIKKTQDHVVNVISSSSPGCSR